MPKIDKSQLMFGVPNRVRDRKYLSSIHGEACWSCGKEESVGAHIRAGCEGGVGLKPSDDLVIPLCHYCHMDQESNPGAEWWLENVLKNLARERYKEWKDE